MKTRDELLAEGARLAKEWTNKVHAYKKNENFPLDIAWEIASQYGYGVLEGFTAAVELYEEHFVREALELASWCIKYDEAINGCANDPNKMASFCTAEGDTLDDLYFSWLGLAKLILKHKGSEEQK